MKKEKITEYRSRARALAEQMTLEEKVSQTLHGAAGIARLGIPTYNWWNEALHGVARAGTATVFPQAIGMAATFDEELIGEAGAAVSTEGRAKFNMQQKFGDHDIYKGLTFWAPNVNIFRDPRWGRGHETFGEDPYLTSRLGVRYIQGLQGDDENYLKAAACAKHFAVHSGPESERHGFDAQVSKQDLFETYLPAFEACVREGEVETVMGAYNRTNGEPCCGSKTLLTDILRNTWGFAGHVTSDCWALKDFHGDHHVTKGPLESVALAMNNGCDLNCGNLFLYLKEAVEEGLVSEERLTEAVTNLLTTRMKLGLFEPQEEVPFSAISYLENDSAAHQMLSRRIAQKSLVLLKNENGLLPLAKEQLHTVGVIGPNANNRKALVGNYEGTASRYVTVLEGIQDYLGDGVRVLYSEGCHLYKRKVGGLGVENDRIAEVRGICEASDVVIACMGLDPGLEGEEGDEGNEFASGDKPDLSLPGIQEDVLRVIAECGKPVVLLLLSGSALAVPWADEHIPAILQCWYPGAQGGHAVADVLFGECAPEGKLPVTFYRTTEELPDFRDYAMAGRTYRYMENEALYPFGYGLSYTEFAVSDVSLDRQTAAPGQSVQVTAKITNIGKCEGSETIQVYVRAGGSLPAASHIPNPQLKALAKVTLQPGETREVTLTLPDRAFALYDGAGDFVLSKGTCEVYVGTQQPDARSAALTGKQPVCVPVEVAETVKLACCPV